MMIERTVENGSVAETPETPHRKVKKTRRGKKRKLRNDLTPSALDVEEIENPLHSPIATAEVCDEMATPPEKISKNCTSTRSRCCILRPTDVPKAPENSTQFIMDDHEGCNLYFSFETRIRAQSGENNHNDNNCREQFGGFQDIDFEYESPDDVDTNAFYEQDFEIIYRRAREEELSSFSRDEMMRQCIELEQRAIELEQQLSKLDPNTLINRLQDELLRLQEENSLLKSQNARLASATTTVLNQSDLTELSPDGAG